MYKLALWAIIITLFSRSVAIQLSMHYNVPEEDAPGRLLGDVVWDAGLADKISRQDYNSLVLRLLNSQHSSLFAIDGRMLKVTESLDRETLCVSTGVTSVTSQTCTLQITIAVEPVDYFLKVNVAVTDVNDNAPRFNVRSFEIVVSEATNLGAQFPLPSATDPDLGSNGVSTYILQEDSDVFGLITSSSPPSSAISTSLLLKQPLDREITDKYSMRLLAIDSAGHSDSLFVEVIVADANDHKPKFTQSSYTVTVSENASKNDVITVVQAIDADVKQNGHITYSIAPTHREVFAIGNSTGEIRLRSSLDFEARSTYEIQVIASDGGQPSLSSSATVTVVVTDANDNLPSITVTASATGSGVSIEEGTAAGTRIAYVTASDADSGANGAVDCYIRTNNFFTLRPVGEGMYGLVTTSQLDREVNDRHDVIITCSDQGIPSLTSSQSLSIAVRDVNDNAPVFSHTQYDVVMKENNAVRQHVFTLLATDADDGLNGTVTYLLQSTVKSMFEVNATSGAVYAVTVLDREVRDRIQFVAFAVDGGSPPKRTSINITVRLSDVNDEPPKFSKPTFNFVVIENSLAGTEVGRIEASDLDLPPNNLFVFSVSNQSDEFRIDANSGRLYTLRQLDREITESYSLLVRLIVYIYNT